MHENSFISYLFYVITLGIRMRGRALGDETKANARAKLLGALELLQCSRKKKVRIKYLLRRFEAPVWEAKCFSYTRGEANEVFIGNRLHFNF
jgi:nitrogenase molybdenum-iron protein alpha/beta subunit